MIFAAITFYTLMILISVLSSLNLTYHISSIIAISIISFFIIVFGILIAFKLYFGKKEKKHEDKENTEGYELLQRVYLERMELILNPTDLDKINLIKKRIPVVKFTILKEQKVCGICKLEIRKDQEIYQCTNCLWFYHIDHMALWLLENKDCPICTRKIEFNE